MAGTTAIANDAFSGFYIGASAGGSFLSGQEDRNFTSTIIGTVTTLRGQTREGLRKNSYFGTAFIGYGGFFFCYQPNVFLATELFVDVANRNDTNSERLSTANNIDLLNTSSRLNIHPVSWGLDIRPGYKICDALLYARLGMGLHRITLNHNNAIFFTPPSSLASSNSKSIDRAVLRLGLGFEHPLCDCLTLRADYIYTYLGKISTSLSDSRRVVADIPRTQVINSNSQVNLCNNAVMLGLVWHW